MLLPLITLLVLSALVGYIGKDRKFGFWGYLFCSLIFTPIIGLVIVFASDKRPAPTAV
ncbi:hypothetical protein MASR2M8_00860 [Opitutaceae bacterium]